MGVTVRTAGEADGVRRLERPAGVTSAWTALVVALQAQIAVSLVAQGVPTLSPFLQVDFGLNHGEVALFGSALAAGTVVALPAAGWAVDRFGDRVVLITGNLVVALSAFAFVATGQLLPAFACLFGIGAGAAAQTPAGSRGMMLAFAPHRRGLAMGLRQTGIPLGGGLAALLLPPMALLAGWRSALTVAGALCLLAAALVFFAYRQAAGSTAPSSHATSSWRGILSRDVVLLGFSGAVLPLGQFCLITYLALYLRETQNVPIETSAGLLVGAQLAGAAGRVVTGWSSDRLFARQRRPPLILVAVLGAVGAVALGMLPPGVPFWAIAAIEALFGFCAIGWQGNWVALLAELSTPARQGRTLGLALTVTYVGISVGPPLFGTLVDRTGSWPLAWDVLAVALGLGAVMIWTVNERRAVL